MRIKNKSKVLILLALILPVLALCGHADSEDYNGYIFKVKESSTLKLAGFDLDEAVEESSGIDELVPEHGLYTAESIEDIYADIPKSMVEYISPDYYAELLGTPDDAGWDYSYINAGSAESYGLTGKGVRIGVIDSGLYSDHEDFQGANIIAGKTFTTLLKSFGTSDFHGHGTFVSGIIAGQPNNGKGVAGIAPEAEIVPLKVLNTGSIPYSVVIKAVYSGVDDYNCDILNMSLGGSSYEETLAEAIKYAIDKGVIVVAAVGNEAEDGNPVEYPSAFDGVIGAGAYDSAGTVTEFSEHNEYVDFCAPGQDITGLSNTDAAGTRVWSGTSFSCPIMAATVALVIQGMEDAGVKREDINTAVVYDFLKSVATDMGDEGYDTYYGWGTVKIDDVIKGLSKLEPLHMYRTENSSGKVSCVLKGRVEASSNGLNIVAAEYSPQGKLLSTKLVYSAADLHTDAIVYAAMEAKGSDSVWKIISMDGSFAPVTLNKTD